MTYYAGAIAPQTTGSPEGGTTGNVGDLITSSDGRQWVKLSGTGNTGWGLVVAAPPVASQARSANPQAGAATLTLDGIPTLTTVGTATLRAIVATNALTRLNRLGYVSGAVAGNITGTRSGNALFAVDASGFRLSLTFGISDAALVAGARMFVGWQASTAAPTNVAPSTLLNCLGIGHDAAGTTLVIYTNDGTATATSTASAFPVAINEAYELTFERFPGQTSVRYRLRRLSTGVIETGLIATKIPANATLLTFNSWRTNNATATAVGVDIGRMSIETFG